MNQAIQYTSTCSGTYLCCACVQLMWVQAVESTHLLCTNACSCEWLII